MTINRQAVSGKIVHEEGFLVQVATESPETNNAIKMEAEASPDDKGSSERPEVDGFALDMPRRLSEDG